MVSKTATTLRRKRSPNGRGLRAECVHRLLQERRRRGDRRSCRVVSLIRRVVALVVTVPTEEGSGGWWWWRAGHRLVAHARLTKNGCDALAAKCCDVFAPWPLTTGCRLTGPPDCIRHRVGRGWGGGRSEVCNIRLLVEHPRTWIRVLRCSRVHRPLHARSVCCETESPLPSTQGGGRSTETQHGNRQSKRKQ